MNQTLNHSSVALFVAAGIFAGGQLTAVPAQAQVESRNVVREIPYKIKPGDTLVGITQQYLRPGLDWRDLGAVNNLDQPDNLRPNQTIYIPSVWFKSSNANATIDSVSGQVTVNGKPAVRSAQLKESDRIGTGKTGVVVVRFPDGTEMSIAPESQVRVDRLRGYFGTQAIDARLDLEKGAIESSTPESKEAEVIRDIRIRTPKATAAVRGTHFRVADSTERSINSVLTGNVAWGNPGQATSLPAGFGSSADPAGKTTPPEALLEAPKLAIAQSVIGQAQVKVPFVPVDGAAAYKIRVAANTSFTRELTEQVVSDASFVLDSQRDGNHFISVRAISENGVEGMDNIGKLTFVARPFAPRSEAPGDASQHFLDRLTLSWQAQERASAYRIQIARDPDFQDIELDRRIRDTAYPYRVVRATRFEQKGGAAKRYWRVATIDGWTVGPFSKIHQFTVRKPAPTPKTVPGNNAVQVMWPPIPDAIGYIVTITDPQRPGQAVRVARSEQSQLLIDGLKPGQYQATVRGVFEQVSSPPGAAQAFEIRPPARTPIIPKLRASEDEYPQLTTP